MQKHYRVAARAAQDAARDHPSLTFTPISSTGKHPFRIVVADRAGRSISVHISSTPRSGDAEVRNFTRQRLARAARDLLEK